MATPRKRTRWATCQQVRGEETRCFPSLIHGPSTKTLHITKKVAKKKAEWPCPKAFSGREIYDPEVHWNVCDF